MATGVVTMTCLEPVFVVTVLVLVPLTFTFAPGVILAGTTVPEGNVTVIVPTLMVNAPPAAAVVNIIVSEPAMLTVSVKAARLAELMVTEGTLDIAYELLVTAPVSTEVFAVNV